MGKHSNYGNSDCTKCTPGKFNNKINIPYAEGCEECEIGKFIGRYGAEKCESCPVGVWSIVLSYCSVASYALLTFVVNINPF